MNVWVWKNRDGDIFVNPKAPTFEITCGDPECVMCTKEPNTGAAIYICRSYGLFPRLRPGGKARKFILTAKEIK